VSNDFAGAYIDNFAAADFISVAFSFALLAEM
jgi:hypothetical protein